MRRRAVFLDRDGTINADTGYLHSPSDLAIFPAALRGLRLLAENQFLLFVVTNQSGIGRGYFSEEEMETVHRKLRSDLGREGVVLEGIAYCPHRPEDGCACRKPSPRLIEKLAAENAVDLDRSFMVGDKLSDVLTGRNAGCRTVLLARPERLERMRELPDWREPDCVAKDLYEAARWIVEQL